MKYYSVAVTDIHSWVMYYGSEPLFRWLTDYLDRRVPGLREHALRENESGAVLNLPFLPREAYLRALDVLGQEAPEAAAKALAAELKAELASGKAPWQISCILGDVKTPALIARNIRARTRPAGAERRTPKPEA